MAARVCNGSELIYTQFISIQPDTMPQYLLHSNMTGNLHNSPNVLQFTSVKESLMVAVQDKYQRSQQLMHTLQYIVTGNVNTHFWLDLSAVRQNQPQLQFPLFIKQDYFPQWL